VPASSNEVRLSYAPVVQRAAPAVVNVYAARAVTTTRNPFMDDPIFRRFFGVPDGGAPSEQPQRSLGSGVIVDTGGLVVTNNHVIEGATEVKVSLADKREYEADIVLKDQRSDLAVLRIRGQSERFPAIDFADSDTLLVGDLVLAIGNPFAVGQTVTHGIISALARTQVGISDYQFFIQTDAAINPAIGWRAGRYERVCRHQHCDLRARAAAAGHRLCHSGQHGARRGRVRQGWRHHGEAAPLGRDAGDARDCREHGPARPTGALVASFHRERGGPRWPAHR
jgi:hypothetical protein